MKFNPETFTADEEAVLSRFFTNVDQPVFALVNLPEVVKGALFARYSRSPKSLRRLFLDEFAADPDMGVAGIAEQLGGENPLIDLRRAERLYNRVFFEYGDDSVAQLGGAHLACEQASNLLTKVLEWGRLAAYLEQSTRYIYYDRKPHGSYQYLTPPEVDGGPFDADYRTVMNHLFDTYSKVVRTMTDFYAARFPRGEGDSPGVWKATIRAKACDTARGLLPASTRSNVGIYATGQAYEAALIRMQAHPLEEVREYGTMMLTELRKVIPSFLRRVDLEDRGKAWSRYLHEVATRVEEIAESIEADPAPRPAVTLTDWDPDAETKIAAAALYATSTLPDDQLLAVVRSMSADERARIVAAMVGDRRNRRHKPGRAAERTAYRFDVVSDYGAFRDLQRHRMLTIEWQRLSPHLGFRRPDVLDDVGLHADWDDAMARAAELYEQMAAEYGRDVAQYAVPFGYRIRYVMQFTVREAFHLIELRSQPSGHPDYRSIVQEMHRQIADVAGHRLLADAMRFVDYSQPDLERLEAERRAERRRQPRSST